MRGGTEKRLNATVRALRDSLGGSADEARYVRPAELGIAGSGMGRLEGEIAPSLSYQFRQNSLVSLAPTVTPVLRKATALSTTWTLAVKPNPSANW